MKRNIFLLAVFSALLTGCASFNSINPQENTSIVQLKEANFTTVGSLYECGSDRWLLFIPLELVRPEDLRQRFMQRSDIIGKPRAIVNLAITEKSDYYALGIYRSTRLCMLGEVVEFDRVSIPHQTNSFNSPIVEPLKRGE